MHIPRIIALTALAMQASTAAPDFVKDIQPILERNCVRCHNADKTKGGLRMDTHELIMEGGDTADAIVPGDPAASELLVRIHLRPIDEGVMPDEGRALEPAEVALLDEWVKAGAHWPKGITLTEQKPAPVKRVPIPDRIPVSAADAANIIDDILARENAGSEAITTPPVGDAVFLRRATIDIIGRIPTMDEIRAFEAMGEGRREKLIDRLLSDKRYADRWTIFMADMLRIRSDIEGGNQLLAYVNGSLAAGKPYDLIARELISASGRANSNPAVGFILGDDVNPMELAAATAQVFLGVRMGCAMCHDHPFDDWQQRDFYDLAAFFGKTKKVGNRDRGMVYATEGDTMAVMWPPEDKAKEGKREAVRPRFPFKSAAVKETPPHIARFEKARTALEDKSSGKDANAELDALLDAPGPTVGRRQNEVLEEAKKESRLLDVHGDIYRASELRNQLAGLITNPRNDFFARAFVNRMWAELIGRGFVEPLDNFSPYVDLNHASTLDFLAHEFTASGFDIRHLIRIITLSDAYRRSQLTAEVPLTIRELSERNFTAAPARRMLGEVIYDSIVIAGHLEDFKWPAGANNKEISREIRVPTGEYIMAENGAEPAPVMEAAAPKMRGDGYDLESSLKLDFNSILSADERNELDTMRKESDEQIKAREMAAMQKERDQRVMKFRTETVTETVDDNPRFDSALRMATPAPPAHFLRVFGQPARTGLGEFRDPSSSLRQQLMMLNGRMTHEASRVGPLEPIHRVLEKDTALAIDFAYREILTRLPTPEEKSEALQLLSENPHEGMADLRWALLNCNEFRFVP
ncbi:DUF1553 domain-containing protein [Akkermansiaceae bacterium]|nr:DUF1553 domain-containing protein [Akkermansiaceae bacterium]